MKNNRTHQWLKHRCNWDETMNRQSHGNSATSHQHFAIVQVYTYF